MKVNDWASLRRLKYDDDFKMLEVGDYFLSGRSVRGQHEGKKPGDRISYYKVLSVDDRKMEYSTVFDILEKD